MTREEMQSTYRPHRDGKRFHIRTLGPQWQVYSHGLQHVCACDSPEVADMVADALEAALREPVKDLPLPDSEGLESIIVGMIERGCVHRSGKALNAVDHREIMRHMREEVTELDEACVLGHSQVLEEAADVFGVLIHLVRHYGFTMAQVEQQEIKKLKERFSEPASPPPAASEPTAAERKEAGHAREAAEAIAYEVIKMDWPKNGSDENCEKLTGLIQSAIDSATAELRKEVERLRDLLMQARQIIHNTGTNQAFQDKAREALGETK